MDMIAGSFVVLRQKLTEGEEWKLSKSSSDIFSRMVFSEKLRSFTSHEELSRIQTRLKTRRLW